MSTVLVTGGSGFIGPARVLLEIGGEERELAAGLGAALLQHGADGGLAFETADGGSHLMSRGEQLQDGMGALGWAPGSPEDAIVATGESLARLGLLKP